MDADTKKREAGCTCHQEEGDSECVIHDPPTCKRCGCEYTMKWPDTEPTKYCNACAHAVVEAAEARAEKAEGEVRYLRAVVAWRKGLAESETCESCKCSDCQAWLSANPEPQPPEGCAP